MIVVECEQRSPEWYAARLGRLTSSCVSEAFTPLKRGGWSAARATLTARLVCERITGKSQDKDISRVSQIERGANLEAEARMYYEAETGVAIDTVGCIQHSELMAACSPDGLTDDNGLIELKCPGAMMHLEYLRGGLPDEYYLQIVHSLWICGRAWGDFVSYHPDFPPRLRMKTIRVSALPGRQIDAHELNVRTFLDEVDKQVQELGALVPMAVELP